MLGNQTYYYASIRKIVVAFARLFNDIKIDRFNGAGDIVETVKIPLTYDSKEKWFYRLAQDPDAGSADQTPVAIVLPRMSYEITGIAYDSIRKLPSTGRTYQVVTGNNATLKAQYNPVPYDISFNLNVMVKNVDDGLMILEQILPFFTPDFTVNVADMPELELEKDIPVVLNGVTPEDSWDGAFTERRMISWTLTFTAKAYIYPPISSIGIIRKAIVDVYIKQTLADLQTDLTASVGEQYTVQPQPTDAAAEDPWTFNGGWTDLPNTNNQISGSDTLNPVVDDTKQ